MGDWSAILNLLLEYAEKLIDNGVFANTIDICVKCISDLAGPLKDAIWLITH